MLFDFLFNRKEKDGSVENRIDGQVFPDKDIESIVKKELMELTLGDLIDYYFHTRCKEMAPKAGKKKVAK